MMKIMDKFFQTLTWIESWFVRIILAVMTFLIALGGLNRMTFSIPMPWNDELVSYLLPWVSFIAVAIGVTYDTHVGIDIVTKCFPAKIQLRMERFVNVFGIFLSCVITYIGFQMCFSQAGQSSPMMGISMAWYYASLPVGWILIGLAFIDRISRSFRSGYGKTRTKLIVEKEDQ